MYALFKLTSIVLLHIQQSVLPLQRILTFIWGRCAMTHASLKHGRTLHQPTVIKMFSLIASFTLSNHLLLGIPLFLLPCTLIFITLLRTYCSSLFITCPYHFHLISLTFFAISPLPFPPPLLFNCLTCQAS